jgi:hypothetical protein
MPLDGHMLRCQKAIPTAYLNDLAFIEQNLAAIHAEHRVHQEIIRYHTEEDD